LHAPFKSDTTGAVGGNYAKWFHLFCLIRNETLAKVFCHNLCRLMSAWYELGIEPALGQKRPDEGEPRQILRFPG
jgi:hypothetical protein